MGSYSRRCAHCSKRQSPPCRCPCFVLCYMHPFCTLSPFFSSGFSPPFPPSSLVSAVPGPVFLFQNTNRCNTVQYYSAPGTPHTRAAPPRRRRRRPGLVAAAAAGDTAGQAGLCPPLCCTCPAPLMPASKCAAPAQLRPARHTPVPHRLAAAAGRGSSLPPLPVVQQARPGCVHPCAALAQPH